MKYCVLYNPIADNSNGKANAERAVGNYFNNSEEIVFLDITVTDYYKLYADLSDDDVLCLCGGDGTINRFVNDSPYIPPNLILYFPCGSGNDFMRDVAGTDHGDKPIELNDYLKDLPKVTVNGKEYRFINGVGFGIDGYCCEEGDRMRNEKPGEKINYTSIAIKGLLFKFKPRKAVIKVDGETRSYEKVWLAPAMFGRCYGGGMYPTPDQSRTGEPRKLSTLIFHDSGKLKTLMIFPGIFKGEHVRHKDCCEVLTGKKITVMFGRPTALQIDGETILGVTSYTAEI